MNRIVKRMISVILAAAVAVCVLALAGCGFVDEFFAEKNQEYNGSSGRNDADRKPASDFTVTDAKGKKVSLSSKNGKPVVVNFWATWCGPCRSELGHFDNAYKEYGDQVEFMMVDLTDNVNETVSGVRSFVSENGYEFPVYFDTEFSASEAYGVNAIPMTLFIEEYGNIVFTHTGAMDKTTLYGYIDDLLEANK